MSEFSQELFRIEGELFDLLKNVQADTPATALGKKLSSLQDVCAHVAMLLQVDDYAKNNFDVIYGEPRWKKGGGPDARKHPTRKDQMK